MSPDSYPKPVHGLRRWWIRYAGSIAVGLLILVTSYGFWKIEVFLDSMVEGNIAGCEQNNEVKSLARAEARATILRATTVDTEALFPDADPQYLKEITNQSIADQREVIEANRPSDCEGRYPDTSVLTVP